MATFIIIEKLKVSKHSIFNNIDSQIKILKLLFKMVNMSACFNGHTATINIIEMLCFLNPSQLLQESLYSYYMEVLNQFNNFNMSMVLQRANNNGCNDRRTDPNYRKALLLKSCRAAKLL